MTAAIWVLILSIVLAGSVGAWFAAPDVSGSLAETTTAVEETNVNNTASKAASGEASDIEDGGDGPGVPLFRFDRPEPAWYTINDDVMGGISQSNVTVDRNLQRLTFSGSVSLENNGGFASVRSQWTGYNLAAFDGVALRLRGDGNTYRFRIRTEATGSEIAYTALFETTAGEWQEVYIPFVEMVPLYRGFVVPAAGALDPASIRSFGLMVSDKQKGDFRLEIDWINAVSENKGDERYVRSEAGWDNAFETAFDNIRAF